MGLEQNWGEVAQRPAGSCGGRESFGLPERSSHLCLRGEEQGAGLVTVERGHTQGAWAPEMLWNVGAGCQGCPGSSPLGASQAPSSRAPFSEAVYLSSPIS